MRPIARRTAPAIIGTSMAPEGMRNAWPMAPPMTTKPNVVESPAASSGGSQTSGIAGGAPDRCRQKRAKSEATLATQATRRYCMKATSRASAPKASAISTIAVAPPGAEPHTPTLPGKICQRLMSQPRRLLAAITEVTTANSTGAFASTSWTMDGVIVLAIRQPTTACAPM